jgi:hypothetical protein
LTDKTAAKLESWLSRADAHLAQNEKSPYGSMELSELGICGRWIMYWSNKLSEQDFASYETFKPKVTETISKCAKQINESYRRSTADSMNRHKPGTKSYSENLFSPIYYLHNHSIRFTLFAGDIEEERSILGYFVNGIAPAFGPMDDEKKQLISDLLEEAKRIGIVVPVEVQEKFALPSEVEMQAKSYCGVLLDLAFTSLERSRKDPLSSVRSMSNISALILSSEALEIYLKFLYDQYSPSGSPHATNEGRRLSIPEYTAHLRQPEGFTPTQLSQFDKSYELIANLLRRAEEPSPAGVRRFVNAVYVYLRSWLGWGYSAKLP